MIRLFRNLKPYVGQILLTIFLVFLQAMANLYLPTLMSDIVDKGVLKGDVGYIWGLGGFMILVTLGGALSAVVASFFASRVASGFGRTLRRNLFVHVTDFALYEFDQIGTASMITRTTNDITQVQTVLVMLLRMAVMAPLMCIGGVIMALSKDTSLSLVILVIMPILCLFIYWILRRGVPLFQIMQVKLDRLNRVLREGLSGIRVIRAFNRVDYEQQRFDRASRDVADTAIKAAKIMASMMPMMMLVMNFAQIAIVWYGGIRVSHGNLQVGDMMAFLSYAMQILFSLMMVSMIIVMLPRASASASRINEVLDTQPSIKDAASLQSAHSATHDGQIEFKNVTFSYPGAEYPALSNISFTAKPGQVTAIIGGTGSGKSSLINLIPRFYDIQSGEIRIGGRSLQAFSQSELREKIGLVPQKAVLFSGTIAENIRYGKEDATDAEVSHAAKVAQAIDFVEKLPEGFDSKVEQGGMNLSGGQKQRLSIARALIRKPDIYIFDDSFSALDFKTDSKLRAALKQETTQATVFIVAQRVSTVMDADQIIVLEEGKIAGIGSHRDLMESCEVYREIVFSQLSEEEIA